MTKNRKSKNKKIKIWYILPTIGKKGKVKVGERKCVCESRSCKKKDRRWRSKIEQRGVCVCVWKKPFMHDKRGTLEKKYPQENHSGTCACVSQYSGCVGPCNSSMCDYIGFSFFLLPFPWFPWFPSFLPVPN